MNMLLCYFDFFFDPIENF